MYKSLPNFLFPPVMVGIKLSQETLYFHAKPRAAPLSSFSLSLLHSCLLHSIRRCTSSSWPPAFAFLHSISIAFLLPVFVVRSSGPLSVWLILSSRSNSSSSGDNVDIDEAPIDSVAKTQLPHSPGHYSSHTGIGVSRGQNSASSGRGKRKRTTGSDAVIAQLSDTIQNLGKVYESTKDNIGDLVGCFKHEKEGAERRMQVFEELKKIEPLTSMERVKVGFLIAKDQSAVDYFFTIDAESKALFVQQILALNNH